MSKRPRSGVTEVIREKRSKHLEDSSREEPSSSRKTPSMQMRQVVSGRRILFNFLEEIGLELGDKIEEQGWVHFCSLNLPTYPTLVRNFYENLIVGDDYLESQVKGKRIILSEELLSSLFRMPHIGNKYLELDDKPQALEAIRGTYNSKGNIVASSLSLEMRLLHNFISRIFIPRSDRFDWVSEETWPLWKRLSEEKPSICHSSCSIR